MKALEALGYMAMEAAILHVRNLVTGKSIDKVDITPEGGADLTLSNDELNNDYELGWECARCVGSGEIDIPCPRCSGQSLHSLLENPCCSGYDTTVCPDCENGIRFEKEY